MADVTVEPIGNEVYRVTVTEGGSTSTHEVTVLPETVQRHAGISTESLVEASFRFLLDREPKEAILRRFGIDVISRYFPEYESRLGDYL